MSNNRYTQEYIIQCLQESAKNNNGYPNYKDFKGATKINEYPNATTIENRFGSWAKGCNAAGFSPKRNRFKYSFSNEELLNYLKLSAKNNNGYPKQSDFTKNNPDFPGMSTIKRRFGSWSRGCDIAGFNKVIRYKTIGDTLELLQALEICFDKFGYKVAPNRKNIDKNKLLIAITNSTDVPTTLGFTSRKAGCKFIKRTFPDKPANTLTYNWLLIKNNWLCCSCCNQVKTVENFYKNNSSIGYDLRCRGCQQPDKVARSNIRRVKQISATVPWSDYDAIRQFYNNCPKGCVVDHIIPLQGKYVCGLHVLNNLQYLSIKENIVKSNYHESEEYWS